MVRGPSESDAEGGSFQTRLPNGQGQVIDYLCNRLGLWRDRRDFILGAVNKDIEWALGLIKQLENEESQPPSRQGDRPRDVHDAARQSRR